MSTIHYLICRTAKAVLQHESNKMEYVLIGLLSLIIFSGVGAYFIKKKTEDLESTMVFHKEDLRETIYVLNDEVTALKDVILRMDPNVLDLNND